MIVDLFAGPGGWDEGAKALGLRPVGVEMDGHACATRHAAGHLTVQAKVDELPAGPFAPLEGLIASPPCQAFSMAGNGAGRAEVGRLHHFIDDWHRYGWTEPGDDWDDPRTPLVLEPLRWIEQAQPTWVALEQVPPVVELWQHIAGCLQLDGWGVWAGVLNAADYGVPQTRKRAFLIAHRDRGVQPPEPTHAKDAGGSLFGVEPWVTMADALGWTGAVDRRQQHDGVPVRAVPVTEPAPTLDGQVGGKWVLNPGCTATQPNRCRYAPDEPAPTIGFGHDAPGWVWERPSTTVVGSFSPEMVAPPTYRQAGDGPRQNQPGAVRITIQEALVLQSFRPDYPLQGPKTAQFLQVGNAVPPLLARRVLEVLL